MVNRIINEIGSNFWINPNEPLFLKELGSPLQFGCGGSDYVWLSSGRAAIKYVIKNIEERNKEIIKTALLPSFTCSTVIEPFLSAGYIVSYYDVDNNLNALTQTIIEKALISHSKIVLFHRYFGFNTINDVDILCKQLRERGIFSIEDCTQNLYSDYEKADADYYIGSIRKWTGIPDGGYAVCKKLFFSDKPEHRDDYLEKVKIRASIAKYNYLFKNEGEKQEFNQLFKDAEKVLDLQEEFFKISYTSSLLQSNLEQDSLRTIRKNNYRVLLNYFPVSMWVFPLFGYLDEFTTPLYFPIIVKERTLLQSYLAKNEIYAPVVWPKPNKQEKVCEAAEIYYEHLLCIPIDQRYNESDMLRIIDVINEYLKTI